MGWENLTKKVMKNDMEYIDLVQEMFHDSKEYSFGELPKTHQKAIKMYCIESEDESLWLDRKFRVGEIPIDFLIDLIMDKPNIKEDFKTFDEYHQWYMKHCGVEDHSTRWPVIWLSDYGDVLEDGWHRFHEYYSKGLEIFPSVMFVIKE